MNERVTCEAPGSKTPVTTELIDGGDGTVIYVNCGARHNPSRPGVAFWWCHSRIVADTAGMYFKKGQPDSRTITLSEHKAQAEKARHHVEALLSLHTTQDFIHGDDKMRTVLTEALAWLNDTKEDR